VSTVDRSGIQVIARAATVLRCLEREPDGLSLGDIAARVDLPRSTVQRIVAALVEEQLLMSASLKARVKLGPGLVQLGAAADVGTEKIVRPFMQELARAADETVDLSVLRRDAAVFVEQIQGTQRLAAVSAIGKEFPLHCTANGKAILSCFAKEDATKLVDKSLIAHPDFPLADRAKLSRELETARRKHLAFDLGEHGVGISAVGVAVVDAFGRPVAVSIPAPTHRFNLQRDALSRSLSAFREKLGAIVGK
jgi:DNA-binding IclR family transcriptional regulator